MVERDLEKIKVMKNHYQDSVEDFIEKYEDNVVDSRGLDGWREDVLTVGQLARQHAKQIRLKKEQVCPTPSVHQKALEVSQLSLKYQELGIKHQQDEATTRQEEKQEENIVMAETEANTFLGECCLLGDIMVERNWTEVEDETVSNAMRSFSK